MTPSRTSLLDLRVLSLFCVLAIGMPLAEAAAQEQSQPTTPPGQEAPRTDTKGSSPGDKPTEARSQSDSNHMFVLCRDLHYRELRSHSSWVPQAIRCVADRSHRGQLLHRRGVAIGPPSGSPVLSARLWRMAQAGWLRRGTFIALDAVSYELKEFWPDVRRWLQRR